MTIQMQSQIKLVLLDIEGCLTDGKGRIIHLEPLQTLQCAQFLTQVGIITGRPQPYAEALLQILGLMGKKGLSVVENGCFLYDHEQDILIPHPDLQLDALATIKPFLQSQLPQGTCFEPGKQVCLSFKHPGMNIEDLYAFTCNILKDNKLVTIAHSNSAVDVTPSGIDKGAGLQFLCTRMGIDIANVLIVGESDNDRAAMAIAGHIACPANATDTIKELVRAKHGYIATRPYAYGVIEIIHHYNLRAS